MTKQQIEREQGVQKKARGLGLGLGVAGGVLAAIVGALAWLQPMNEAHATEITVYKSPTCGCCKKWVEHLENAGFKVATQNMNDVTPIKEEHGVRPQWRSCHTALVDGYVLEGHVPVDDIKRLLAEKPKVAGLAVPGMPMGSPGMEGDYQDPYDVISFNQNGTAQVYARY